MKVKRAQKARDDMADVAARLRADLVDLPREIAMRIEIALRSHKGDGPASDSPNPNRWSSQTGARSAGRWLLIIRADVDDPHFPT
jgi:hypothetical protein